MYHVQVCGCGIPSPGLGVFQPSAAGGEYGGHAERSEVSGGEIHRH